MTLLHPHVIQDHALHLAGLHTNHICINGIDSSIAMLFRTLQHYHKSVKVTLLHSHVVHDHELHLAGLHTKHTSINSIAGSLSETR